MRRDNAMLKHAMLSTAALVFLTDSAVAQTTTTQSTTVTAPSAIAPAPGTASSSESRRTVDSNGNEVDSTKTTYGSAYGSESQSTTTVTKPAPQAGVPEVVTTTKKTTTISTSD
jgi:hypothetical protein